MNNTGTKKYVIHMYSIYLYIIVTVSTGGPVEVT